ncbi:EAL domain-containing protein [Thalassotalea sp. G2M2-11]|uniref:EAL domain-containing protein n=1 Tax=Thalassotalea sp. G2M2-11 TaxID=2787627 RepID=UPI0019D2A50E
MLINLHHKFTGIEQHTNNKIISTEYSYLIDQKNELAIDDITQRLTDFTAAEFHSIPYQLSTQTVWLKLTVTNNSIDHHSLVLHADNSLLNTFNIYSFAQQSDQLQPIVTKEDILSQVYPHINFTLTAKKKTSFIIELQTEGPPNIPVMVLQQGEFQHRLLYAQLLYGAFIGIVLLMTMYNLILFFAVKDKVYLIYIGYLVCATLVMSSLTGFGYLIFSSSLQATINSYLLFIDYYLVIFLLSFTLLFLRYQQQPGQAYLVGKYFCWALIACSFYSLTIDTIAQTKLFFSLQPIVYVFTLYLIFRRLRDDFAWAKFYVLSWIPLLIGAAIQPLVLLNYLDYSFITRNAFLFAVMAEITLMAFALAERMRRHEQDRINDIAYHVNSGLPRKSNIESFINQLNREKQQDFSVLVIKPEHIEKVALYIDDAMNTELFKRLNQKLSSLFEFNDAIYPLTDKKEKLCFINNNCFAIVLNNQRNKQSVETLIQSIQIKTTDNFVVNNINLPLTAIVGIAKSPEHGTQSHQLINHAILAANCGENSTVKWATYKEESSNEASYLLKLTRDLKVALENNELEVYHQPQIDLRTLRVCSSECLLRWQHKQEGFIPPAVFIPIAEDMGLINELTQWVIKQSLTQQRTLTEEHGYNHMISINISGKDVASAHFFTQCIDLIEASEVPADKIIFELTESASFAYNEHALSLIEKLTELGVTISIDDFGTGYSTMSQISHLPFQELKVDREFVENVNDDKKRMVIAKTTVKMAKGLGLEVVAEGINSQADEDTLRDFGCDIGQGYFYAKPMAFDDYIGWLNDLDNGRIKQPLQGEFIPANK